MRVLSSGMSSPVGLTAEATAAAIRCGLSNFQELPYVHGRGEQVIGSLVPNVGFDFEDRARIGRLLLSAIRDCLIRAQFDLGSIAVVLCLGETGRPGGCHGRAGELLDEILTSDLANFDARFSTSVATGHTACFEGLLIARDILRQPSISGCLVCGVDSYLNAETLRWLDDSRRLKTVDNSDGIIPGECAAAVMVGKPSDTDDEKRLAVIGLGSNLEPVHVLSDQPFRGDGLSEATRLALSDAKMMLHDVAFRVSDLTGEAYGFKEQALVVSRLLRERRAEFPLWHSAECLGDVGAAAGAVQLNVLQSAFNRQYAPGSSALCFTSAVSGNRAVAVVEAT